MGLISNIGVFVLSISPFISFVLIAIYAYYIYGNKIKKQLNSKNGWKKGIGSILVILIIDILLALLIGFTTGWIADKIDEDVAKSIQYHKQLGQNLGQSKSDLLGDEPSLQLNPAAA